MMARIRTIKPDIASHEGLYDLEIETSLPIRFAWCMLFTVADREGRFNWRPRTLKAQILPHDEIDFSRVLDAWLTRAFLVKYRVKGEWFGWIPTFRKHQFINNRESESDLPSIDEADEIIDNRFNDMPTRKARVNDASTTREVHAQGEGKGREGKGREGKERRDVEFGNSTDVDGARKVDIPGKRPELELDGDPPPPTQAEIRSQAIERIFDHWRSVHEHQRAKLDDKRAKVIGRALDAGYCEDDLCRSISGYRNSPHHMGRNEQRTVYDDIELQLRDAKHIDAGLRFFDDPPLTNVSEQTQRIIDQTEDWEPPETRARAAEKFHA